MPLAYLSLGSNLGHRASFLSRATHLMSEQIGNLVSLSAIVETKSVGFETYPFLNQVAIVDTELAPIDLLEKLQKIEKLLGRTKKSQLVEGIPIYYDRTIDIDILLFDNITLQSDRLTIPHPHLHERVFFKDLLDTLSLSSID